MFYPNMDSFIQQGCIQLIKTNSKVFHITFKMLQDNPEHGL